MSGAIDLAAGFKLNPAFDGYPFLQTKVEGAFHHLMLLPAEESRASLLGIALAQTYLNQLPACMVVGPQECYYIGTDGDVEQREDPPVPRIVMAGRLMPATEFSFPEQRLAHLRAYVERTGPKTGYVVADPKNGGRPATAEDVRRLSELSPEGVPLGLERCPHCREWAGEALYDAQVLGRFVVRVYCVCQNDSLCARCRGLLAERKLCGSEYDKARGAILYTPGFCGLSHRCPDLAEATS